MSFLVTGLPRSRTAWLSAFLTSGGAYCKHEGLLEGVDSLVKWLNRSELHGDSDSGLPLVWDQVIPRLESEPKIVVILRDREEVAESLSKYWEGIDFLRGLDPVDLLNDLSVELEKIKKDALLIQYKDLENIDALRRVWEFCLPELTFDLKRAELLTKLNIQQCTKSFNHS